MSKKIETFLSMCFLSVWNDWYGGTIPTHEFDLTDGKKLKEPLSRVHG